MNIARQRIDSMSRMGSTATNRDVDCSGQQIFRSMSAWVYGGSVWAFCALCAVLAILQEPLGLALKILLVLAAVSLLTWVVLVRPHLGVLRDAVVVCNVWRTHVIPYGAVRYVRTRGLVEVIASFGGAERAFRSWNAPGNRAWNPSRGEVYAATHPGAARQGARTSTGSLQPGSALAQRTIEARMDRVADNGSGSTVTSVWNTSTLLPAGIAVLVSIAAWWL